MNSINGSSFIEIMVSLLLISLLLLFINAMQLQAIRYHHSSYYLAVAIQQIHILQEQLFVYNNQNVDHIIAKWNAENSYLLPQGRGELFGEYPNSAISIFWGGMQSMVCDNDKEGQSGCLQLSI